MRFAIVGLGRMGANMAPRRSVRSRRIALLRHGYGGHPVHTADEQLVRT